MLHLAKGLGAVNSTGRIFLFSIAYRPSSIYPYFFFLCLSLENHNALIFFHERLYTLYTMEKYFLLVFDCSNAYCLQPLNHTIHKNNEWTVCTHASIDAKVCDIITVDLNFMSWIHCP